MFFDYQRNYLQELIAAVSARPDRAAREGDARRLSTLPLMARPELLVYDFLYDNARRRSAAARRPRHVVLRVGHRPGLLALGLGQARDVGQPDRRRVHASRMRTKTRARSSSTRTAGSRPTRCIDSRTASSRRPARTRSCASTTAARRSSRWSTRSRRSSALHAGDGWLYAAADVTPAYKDNAAVSKVQREVVFLKPNVVVVYDRVATGAGTTQTWQLATPTAPSIAGTTATISGGGTR